MGKATQSQDGQRLGSLSGSISSTMASFLSITVLAPSFFVSTQLPNRTRYTIVDTRAEPSGHFFPTLRADPAQVPFIYVVTLCAHCATSQW